MKILTCKRLLLVLGLALGVMTVWSSAAPKTVDGIGFHGAVGFELKLVSHFAFILEGQGRYVKIGSFEGKKLNFIEGTLNYYESQFGGKWYPKVDVIDGLTPIGIRNLRKAKVDFSGFTLRAGIKITF